MGCSNDSGTRSVDFTVCCGESGSNVGQEPDSGGGGGGSEEGEGESESVETGEINGSFIHDGKKRTYIVYVPENWEENMPLLLNLHGYTMTAEEQMNYGDFRGLAESEGFVIVHPQGTKDKRGKTHWNVGWTVPTPFGEIATSNTDDLGFLQELIEKMEEDYKINPSNIFSTGMSNGGFMSYHLACSGITAGVASVTGSMSDYTYENCSASKPVLDIHGTGDSVVAYDGSTAWNVSTPEVVQLWVENNGCDTTPTSSTDGDIQHDVYSGGTAVEQYIIDGWGHDWPEWAADTVWEFFKDHITANPPPPEEPPDEPEPPTTPDAPNTAGKVEAEKVPNHIARTYWDLLEPDNMEKGKNDLKACVPAIGTPCDGPPC